MATGAIGATIEQTVIGFGARPCTGGFVTVLTDRLPAMDGSCWARGRTKAGAQVASRALRRQLHIGMKLTRVPAGVATLVATVAIGNRHPAERLVRYVIGRRPVRRRKAAGVARRALVSHRHLAMVPVRGFPG
jgi:hypothetical protein